MTTYCCRQCHPLLLVHKPTQIVKVLIWFHLSVPRSRLATIVFHFSSSPSNRQCIHFHFNLLLQIICLCSIHIFAISGVLVLSCQSHFCPELTQNSGSNSFWGGGIVMNGKNPPHSNQIEAHVKNMPTERFMNYFVHILCSVAIANSSLLAFHATSIRLSLVWWRRWKFIVSSAQHTCLKHRRRRHWKTHHHYYYRHRSWFIIIPLISNHI